MLETRTHNVLETRTQKIIDATKASSPDPTKLETTSNKPTKHADHGATKAETQKTIATTKKKTTVAA